MKRGQSTETPGLFETPEGFVVRVTAQSGSVTTEKMKTLRGASRVQALIALEKLKEEAQLEAEAKDRGEKPNTTLMAFAARFVAELGVRQAQEKITPRTAIAPYHHLASKAPSRMRNSPTNPFVPGSSMEAKPIIKRKVAKSGTCFASPPNEERWLLCCLLPRKPAKKNKPAVLKPRLIIVRRLPWSP